MYVTHINSCTATIHVTNIQGAPYGVQRTEHWKTQKVKKTSNLNKGGDKHWQLRQPS